MGIRPEDFEDAALVAAGTRDSGITFRANIEVVESMGSDVYVYFAKEFASEVNAAELQELAEDSGSADTGAANTGMLTARLATETTAREGQEAELWADLRSDAPLQPGFGRQHHAGRRRRWHRAGRDDGHYGRRCLAGRDRSGGSGRPGGVGRTGRAGNGGYLTSRRSRAMTSSFHSWVRMRR